MFVFGLCFVLYFFKLSAGHGYLNGIKDFCLHLTKEYYYTI